MSLDSILIHPRLTGCPGLRTSFQSRQNCASRRQLQPGSHRGLMGFRCGRYFVLALEPDFGGCPDPDENVQMKAISGELRGRLECSQKPMSESLK